MNSKAALLCLLIGLTACEDEMRKDPSSRSALGYTVEATTDRTTKTSLVGMNVVWQKDDAIEVFGADDYVPLYYGLSSGQGQSTAKFQGSAPLKSGIAKYPYRDKDRYEGKAISTVFEATQEFTESSFASGASIMAASAQAGEVLSFSNLCSAIRISLTGQYTLQAIELRANDPQTPMSGEATITLESGIPVLRMTESDNDAVTLDCSGVSLLPSDAREFIVVVPSQLYSGGITINVLTTAGSMAKSTVQDLNLKPGELYTVPTFNLTLFGGLTPSTSLQGEGTEASPFQISSVEDLLGLQYAVNNKLAILSATTGQEVYSNTAWYILTKDLDLAPCCGLNVGSWMPIGVSPNYFSGHLNGDGKTITNLYIGSDAMQGGLFSYVVNGYLENLDVTGDVRSAYSGILCGYNYGTIEGCTSRGSVMSSTYSGGTVSWNRGSLIDCTNHANVSIMDGQQNFSGGLCGVSCATNSGDMSVISGCVNYGEIRCEVGAGLAGGIAGHIEQTRLEDCVNYSLVSGMYAAGGIAGEMNGSTASNCVNSGDVWTKLSESYDGGICGMLFDTFQTSGSVIENCVNTGNLSSGGQAAGICAYSQQTVSYCYWIYDKTTGLADGVLGGTTTGIQPLTVSQMTGDQETEVSLIGGHKNIIDALNFWAFTQSSAARTFSGWQKDSQTGWPCLTFLPAQPVQGDPFLQIITQSPLTVSTLAQTVTVSLTSSSQVSISSMPGWITGSQTSMTGSEGAYSLTFSLEITKNVTGDSRQGTVKFENADEIQASLIINQGYAYYSEDYSRNGKVITLQTHSEGNGIELIFMGDGYVDKDLKSGLYESDIRSGVDAFFAAEPYASFKSLFDIRYVELVSPTNTFTDKLETALEVYFGNGTSIGGNDTKVIDLCKTVTGKDDLSDVTAIIMANARRYSGTCYMYYPQDGDYGRGLSISYFGMGTSSSGPTSMAATLRHEAGGHGFGKLSDEYAYEYMGRIPENLIQDYQSFQGYGWYPNVDFTSDPFTVRWSKFITDERYAQEKLGVYEGAATYWTGAYRPTENSIMRYNTGQFNAPSREAIYYKIHRLAYGSSWTYNYDAFLVYDRPNRQAAVRKETYTPETFVPLHPPVIVRKRP